MMFLVGIGWSNEMELLWVNISLAYIAGWIGYCLSRREDEPFLVCIIAGASWPLVGFVILGLWIGTSWRQAETVAAAEGNVAMTEDSNWKLLTVSYGGTISLLKRLTKAECDKIVAALPTAKNAGVTIMEDGSMLGPDQIYASKVPDSWIKTIECFQ